MGFWRKLARAYANTKEIMDDAKKQVCRERQKAFVKEQLHDYNLFLNLNKLEHAEQLQNAFDSGVQTGLNYCSRRIKETFR